jgi:quercetin dioxygenase-like cupin family protein
MSSPAHSPAHSPARSASALTVLLAQQPPDIPSPAEVMTATVELPPGDPGTPPHRHSGPVFGYMLEGEMMFELEGERERVIRAGEAFWEPGGDVIHYQAANHLSDRRSRFVVVMIGIPGEPMLTVVSAAELAERRGRRAPRPAEAGAAQAPRQESTVHDG